jgi:hypothetical protein
MHALRQLSILGLLCGPLLLHGQTRELADSTHSGRYALVLYAGGGLSWYPGEAGTPKQLDTRSQRLGPSATARLMWLPDHRLRVGFESGWTTLYSYTIEGPGPKGRVQQMAVPLLLMWSMPLTRRFSLFAGYGTYRLTSKLDYLGITRSSTFSLGYAAALSYVLPLGPTTSISFEGKWYNAAETRHTVLAFQTELVWKLYRW